jgi:hypothetical protein
MRTVLLAQNPVFQKLFTETVEKLKKGTLPYRKRFLPGKYQFL